MTARRLWVGMGYRREVAMGLCAALALSCAAQVRNAGGRPVHNEPERAARWKSVTVPYRSAGLTPRQQQMVAKLADACRLMDTLYWHQSDLGGWAMGRVTQNAALAKLFGVMGSRWDMLDENSPFIGEEPMPPGHELYPYGLTRAQIEAYVAALPVQ